MAKKSKAIRSLEAQREYMAGIQEISAPEYIPFRSDLLNLFVGGIGFGGFTEISGDPNLYKSTIAAEVIGAALTMGAHVIVHDKERKLEQSRFTTLGIHGANKQNPKFWYFRQDWPRYRLTIEQYFRDMLDLFTVIRNDDLQRVKREFEDNSASDEAYEYYRRCLPEKERTKARTAGRAKTVASKLVIPALLRKQDRSRILTVLDSSTATPADEEAPDENGEVGGDGKALRARVWSKELCNMMWADDRVAGLHLAQKRLHLNFGGRSYKKAASTTAQEFYYNCRMMTIPMAGGRLTRNPDDGTIIIGNPQNVAKEKQINQIGQIILMAIHKTLRGVKTEIPLFMLAMTGTDVVNSMWQFLVQRGLITHHHQGAYKFKHGMFSRIWPNETFKPVEFINFYRNEGQRLWGVLQDYMHVMLTGAPMEQPAVEVELPSPFDEEPESPKKPAKKKTSTKKKTSKKKTTRKKASKKKGKKK